MRGMMKGEMNDAEHETNVEGSSAEDELVPTLVEQPGAGGGVGHATGPGGAVDAGAQARHADEAEAGGFDHLRETARELETAIGLGPGSTDKPPLPRVLAIANQKGGVGKTTTAVNLGASLAELGYRVLVIDLDPQGNATTGLGVNARNLESSVYDVILHDVPIEDCIEPTNVRNLFVVPATIDLAGAEIELVPLVAREARLGRAIAEFDTAELDYVLIDCPPSLGLLTVNALVAAPEVLIPIQCEYYALEGLEQLLRTIELVKSHLNPGLSVSTILLTMFDSRTRLASQVAEEVRSHFGDLVLSSVIPRSVRVSEAPSYGQSVMTYDPGSNGAVAYLEAAREMAYRSAGAGQAP